MKKQQNNNWKGWAIAAIWIGTGLSAFGAGIFTVFIAVMAMIATDAIAEAE